MSRVLKRTVTGASLAVGVVLLLVLDRLLPAGVMPWAVGSLLCALGVRELARMGSLRPLRLAVPLGLATAALVVASFPIAVGLATPPDWLTPGRLLGAGYALAGVLSLAAAFVLAPAGARRPGFTALLALWSVPPLFGLILVEAEWGTRGLGALILLAKIGDVFGYFVGRSLGKRHPFPNLSPGKTVAGCVGSAIGGTAAGLLVGATGLLAPGSLGLAGAALAGLVINLVAQAGDLAESWVKRHSGVKDSSGLVGPAGGILDVVDSLLLATPVALLVFPALFG